jgi:putative hydrolase of the HAD superfamily
MTTHLLFDFFGTLTKYSASRTEQGYERSFRLLQNAGSRLAYDQFLDLWTEVSSRFDEVAESSHREFSMVDLGSAFLSRVDISPTDVLLREFVETYLLEWNKGVIYLPEVPELIGRLSRRFELAVITNTHDPNLVPDHLERMGISRLFGKVITSVELGIRKPSPEIFQHALGALDASPEQCLYVGDSYETDYLGARAAGVRAVLIDPLSKTPVPNVDRLDSIASIEKFLSDA